MNERILKPVRERELYIDLLALVLTLTDSTLTVSLTINLVVKCINLVSLYVLPFNFVIIIFLQNFHTFPYSPNVIFKLLINSTRHFPREYNFFDQRKRIKQCNFYFDCPNFIFPFFSFKNVFSEWRKVRVLSFSKISSKSSSISRYYLLSLQIPQNLSNLSNFHVSIFTLQTPTFNWFVDSKTRWMSNENLPVLP